MYGAVTQCIMYWWWSILWFHSFCLSFSLKYTYLLPIYHFFRATLTKIHAIKINDIWTQISFNTPQEEYLKNTRFSRIKKEKNVVKSRKVIFRKSQKLVTERVLSELQGGGLFSTFKSYSFNFNGGLRKRRTEYCLLQTPSRRGKQFVIFFYWPLEISSHLSPLWLK